MKIILLSKINVIQINKIDTNNLSAIRSSKAPNSEVRFFFLAIKPSRKSVIDAITKIINEKTK